MAVIHISEAEAIRDFASVLAQVRNGVQVIIEAQDCTIALIHPVSVEAEEPEAGHEEWFRMEVQRTLQNVPDSRISEEDAEAIMAEHRRAALLRLHGTAA